MSGDEGAAKGLLNEQRLVDLLNSGPRPSWLFRASKANEGMDQRGIDVEVFTDVGTLYLQVKSSSKEAQRFRKKYRELKHFVPISVVVLQDDKSLEDIRKQAFSLLIAMRDDKRKNKKKRIYYLPNSWRKINEFGEYNKDYGSS